MTDQKKINADDLDLIDDRMEDEYRDAAELWSEFDEAEGTTAATDDPEDTPPADEGREDEGEEWDAAGDAGQDEDRDGDAPKGDSPKGDTKPEGNAPSGDQQTQDIWANAPEEYRAAYEAARSEFENRDRRLRGQVSALQRQINELIASQKQAPAAPGGAAGKADGEQAQGFLGSDDWQSFRDEYPEVAGPLEGVISNLIQHTTRLEKELSAIGGERRQAALDEQANLLAEVHPDWTEVTADEAFGEWLASQPRHIREAAVRNANEIVDFEEAADVVGRFKAFRGEQQPPQAGNGRGNGNNRLASRRQRQLESASAARSRGPGAATGIPEDGDPETIWKQFDEMERREARA